MLYLMTCKKSSHVAGPALSKQNVALPSCSVIVKYLPTVS